MVTGAPIAHVGGLRHRPLPTPKPYTTHRPWCAGCKMKHDADQLNTDGLCARCVLDAERRAESDRRYAERQAELRETQRREREAATPTTNLPQAGKQGKPTTRSSAPRARQASRTSGRAPEAGPTGPRATTDTTRIRRLYLEGNSIPEVARITGHVPATIRRVLIGSQIQLRDDRRTKSGGKPIQHSPELVEAVRRTYLEDGLSIRETAHKLGLPHKTVTKVLERHAIPRRPDAFSPGYQRKDQAKRLKDEIAELGVPVRTIKEWAIGAGLLDDLRVGLPSAAIVTAYRAARDAGSLQQPAEMLTELQSFAANAPASLIRTWATRKGLPTGDRGPVPESTRMAYAADQYERTGETP